MTASLGPPTGGTAVLGNQVTNTSVVFSVAAEQTAWASRSVRLDAFAGQSGCIGFRNDSVDTFLLVIDDIVVESIAAFDPALLGARDVPTQPYARPPAPLAFAVDLQAEVRNSGSPTLTQATPAAPSASSTRCATLGRTATARRSNCGS